MNESIKAGILGVGNIGDVHLRSLSVIGGAEVVAVADVNTDRRKDASERTNSKAYSSYKDLLKKEDLDLAVVALPPFLHKEATLTAVDYGVNVFVEKPFARSAEEAYSMIDAAGKNSVKLGVDHTIRYQPDVREMKRRFDEGRIGHVPLAYISRINNGPFSSPPDRPPVPEWQLDPEMTGGGVVFRLGVHLLDVLEWFFGELSVEYAHLDRQLNSKAEDTALVVLGANESNTTAIMTCGSFQWESIPDVNMTFRLQGTTDFLESRSFVPDSLETHAVKSMVKNVANRGLMKEPEFFKPTFFYQAHYRALKDFVDSIASDQRPPVSGQEGLRTIKLAERIYESAEETI